MYLQIYIYISIRQWASKCEACEWRGVYICIYTYICIFVYIGI